MPEWILPVYVLVAASLYMVLAAYALVASDANYGKRQEVSRKKRMKQCARAVFIIPVWPVLIPIAIYKLAVYAFSNNNEEES